MTSKPMVAIGAPNGGGARSIQGEGRSRSAIERGPAQRPAESERLGTCGGSRTVARGIIKFWAAVRYVAVSAGRWPRMTDKATSDLWWKDAVIYCADVATWVDSDGDGVGDLAGLTGRLDYLSGLGVTTLWMMPFYPSPLGDDGYDITDYYAVDPRFGTLGDFVEMIRTADNLGIRVLVDLVLSHTSNQHPWFQQARRGQACLGGVAQRLAPASPLGDKGCCHADHRYDNR